MIENQEMDLINKYNEDYRTMMELFKLDNISIWGILSYKGTDPRIIVYRNNCDTVIRLSLLEPKYIGIDFGDNLLTYDEIKSIQELLDNKNNLNKLVSFMNWQKSILYDNLYCETNILTVPNYMEELF